MQMEKSCCLPACVPTQGQSGTYASKKVFSFFIPRFSLFGSGSAGLVFGKCLFSSSFFLSNPILLVGCLAPFLSFSSPAQSVCLSVCPSVCFVVRSTVRVVFLPRDRRANRPRDLCAFISIVKQAEEAAPASEHSTSRIA